LLKNAVIIHESLPPILYKGIYKHSSFFIQTEDYLVALLKDRVEKQILCSRLTI